MSGTTTLFGDVELDLAAHELWRGGELVPVEPQVFDVLAYLVEHRDRLVLKTELLDEVWGDRFVSESTLTSRIKQARRAVGDTGREQRIIRTVHGRGYRFVAETTVAAAGSGPMPSDLSAVTADVRAGRGRAVVVAAPTGRARRELLDDLYHDAAAAGLLVARGRVQQVGPLSGVIDALDELVQRRPTLLDGLPEGCRTELVSVLAGNAPSTIGRLQLAARELVLAAAAVEGAVVVVLQDLELADRATRTLVEQWARLTRRVAFGLVVAHSDPGSLSGLDVVEPAPSAVPADPVTDSLAAARKAFGGRDWATAYEGFAGADGLGAADLDAYAESAHWTGRGVEVAERYQAAYRAHLDAGAPHRAGYSAFMVSIHLRLRGDAAPADGWLSRAHRVLADQPEGSEHGYPLYLETARLMGVDLDDAVASAQRMQDLGARFGDQTLVALGVFFEGRALIKQAKVREGLSLLDEAMAAALSDTLEPMWTGAIYCGLLDACHELVDLRRAQEWTEATRKWCEPLPVASLYPGICRVHTAEMLQQQGAWEEAEVAALGVCRDMASIDVFAMADAFYEVGEIRRRRGDDKGAEEAFASAHEAGRDPQPGLALLRVAQGRVEAAATSIASALATSDGSRLERAPLHAAQVTIALRAGALDLAEASAVEVAATARAFASPGLAAVGSRCTGAVALARGEPVVALAALRVALTAWQELDVPHEVACTRVLLAQAYEAMGDADTAGRELSAARATFERLGAASDLCGLNGLTGLD